MCSVLRTNGFNVSLSPVSLLLALDLKWLYSLQIGMGFDWVGGDADCGLVPKTR